MALDIKTVNWDLNAYYIQQILERKQNCGEWQYSFATSVTNEIYWTSLRSNLTHPVEVEWSGLVHLVDGVDDQDVHQVVRIENEVESSGKPTFRDVGHSDKSSSDRDRILKWFKTPVLKLF